MDEEPGKLAEVLVGSPDEVKYHTIFLDRKKGEEECLAQNYGF